MTVSTRAFKQVIIFENLLKMAGCKIFFSSANVYRYEWIYKNFSVQKFIKLNEKMYVKLFVSCKVYKILLQFFHYSHHHCHLTATVVDFRIFKNILFHEKNAKIPHINFQWHQNEKFCYIWHDSTWHRIWGIARTILSNKPLLFFLCW